MIFFLEDKIKENTKNFIKYYKNDKIKCKQLSNIELPKGYSYVKDLMEQVYWPYYNI